MPWTQHALLAPDAMEAEGVRDAEEDVMPKDIDDVYAELRTTALGLVRQIKDQAFDDAMLTLLSAMLALRAHTQHEVFVELQAHHPIDTTVEKAL
jgi:hypothetical protein